MFFQGTPMLRRPPKAANGILPTRKRIWVATPYGKDGMGGIDRLNDAIFDSISLRPELGLDCVRLVTRGKRGLARAQGVFALALVRFCASALSGKIDLLHIHLSDRGSSYRKAILGMAARTLKVPYVLHLHGVYLREAWAKPAPIFKYGLKQLFNGSVQVIVLGRYWREVLLERIPEACSRIIVLPNATPTQPSRRVRCAGDPVRITFLGQLGARKGVPELVKALGRLEHAKGWSATIAGDGDVEGTRAQAGREGILDRVTIPGWLHAAARTELLADTDILVLPSHAENLPMVVVEGFAHGLAVIATPVGAVPEVVEDGYNGILVPSGDEGSLATAIERLVLNEDLRRSLGAAAKKTHSERFEFNKYIYRLADIWNRACR
jgi:glycosyltransferase involved in cell wall biosynthesis